MIKYLVHLLFFITLCVVLSTCKHEPVFDPTTCGDAQTIDEMKQWVLFKPGTYWIYEEETSGDRDTVIVTEHFDGVSSGGYAAFGCVMHSSYDGYNYDYYFNDSYSRSCDWSEGCTCFKVFCNKSKPGDFVGDDRTFIFPLKEGNYLGMSWGGGDFGYISITNYHFTVSTESHQFPECVEFTIDHAVQHNWTKVRLSLSMNIGIVRKEQIEMNETWNLIEYQIVQ